MLHSQYRLLAKHLNQGELPTELLDKIGLISLTLQMGKAAGQYFY